MTPPTCTTSNRPTRAALSPRPNVEGGPVVIEAARVRQPFLLDWLRRIFGGGRRPEGVLTLQPGLPAIIWRPGHNWHRRIVELASEERHGRIIVQDIDGRQASLEICDLAPVGRTDWREVRV